MWSFLRKEVINIDIDTVDEYTILQEGFNLILCYNLILCFHHNIHVKIVELYSLQSPSLQMTRGRGEGGAVLGSVARLAVVLAAAVTSLALATSMMAASVSGCNEAVCASIVSKCMLLQSCKCELQPDCTCCKVDRNNKCIV